jgi:hypothetical protein
MGSYDDLAIGMQVQLIKNEFVAIVRRVFETPSILRTYIADKKLSSAQAKTILTAVDKLNASPCACCRTFNPSKLKLAPTDEELEPLIDIARAALKTRHF